MNKFSLLLTTFCISLSALAQRSVVGLDKLNVFYIGVANPVRVMAEGYSCKVTDLEAEGCTITPIEDCSYEVLVERPGIVLLKVVVKDSGGTTIVGEHQFRVKHVPDPTARVGGKSNGEMAVNIFRAQIGVSAVLENFDFDAKFKVTSFHMEILRSGRVVYENMSQSARFDKQTYKFFNELSAGDEVVISDIHAVGPDRRDRELNIIRLKLI